MSIGDHIVEGAIVGFIEEELADEEKEEQEASESCEPVDLDKDFERQETGDAADGHGERPKGAVSLKKKKYKLPKFEQWVKDVISGKKDVTDEL